MSILSRILAFLNIVAAIVVLYFMAQVYVARLSWQKALRALEERRDGIPTLPPPSSREVPQMSDDLKERRDGKRKESLLDLVRRDFPDRFQELEKNPPQSEEAWRLALLRILFPQEKPELLADLQEAEKIRQQYGLSYDDLRLLAEDHISRTRNELLVEEQHLLNRRRELEILRARIEEEIKRANERLVALQNQVETEKAQHDKIAALIRARRLEIVFWLVRLGEAYNARQLAEARFQDMQTEHTRLEQENAKLQEELVTAEGRIRMMENRLAQGGRGP